MTILFHVDRNSSVPLFRQIIDGITGLIESGDLVPGQSLPASRTLAAQLGINRSTVYKAYQELWALGYIDSTPGSYSIVRKRPKLNRTRPDLSPSLINWIQRRTENVAELAALDNSECTVMNELLNITRERNPDEKPIDLVSISPDPRLMPTDDYRKCISTVLANQGSEILTYGDPQGYLPLRERIAERMSLHGIHTRPDEIMLTTGAQSALDLLCKFSFGRGVKIAAESPTYVRLVGLAKLYGIQIAPVPMTTAGANLDVLERTLASGDTAFLYTIPNFHNPTGISTSQEHREQLLRMCETYSVPLVEDGFEEEMKYYGKAVLPIKSMDRHRIVLYIGSFSKVLFPGVRIGWINADREIIKELKTLQKYSQLFGPSIEQAAMELFCRNGLYENHIKRMHRVFRKKMDSTLAAMKEYLPPAVTRWTEPAGGYTLMIRIAGTDRQEYECVRTIARHGVLVYPGSLHFCSPPEDIHIRISIGTLNTEEIQTGIRRLGAAIEEFCG